MPVSISCTTGHTPLSPRAIALDPEHSKSLPVLEEDAPLEAGLGSEVVGDVVHHKAPDIVIEHQ